MTARAPAVERVAARVHVTGVVQGVGFRPFVYRLAARHSLKGGVLNSAGDVRIDLEGAAPDIEAFLQALTSEAPPLARIDNLTAERIEPSGAAEFAILPSLDDREHRQPVSPDVGVCAACERELFAPDNRRYRYPFITCTDCGPRFTVIEAMPYDRERTSMRAFAPCADCMREYHTPGDRRYRSETNSCPECGPRLWMEIFPASTSTLDSQHSTFACVSSSPPVPLSLRERGDEVRVSSPEAEEQNPIGAAARLLLQGKIVAIRGLGGFHLAVDATNDAAVRRLRARKHRDERPLAVMVRTIDDAGMLAEIEPAEEALLVSKERPIVLVRSREPGRVLAESIAPGLDRIGVMLAYTPLHHLLLEAVDRPLVMTSGNMSEEPIATGNAEALERLRGIADAFLLHDREIVCRYDDSVLRVVNGAPVFLRRARGYAPLPIELPVATPVPFVAVGSQLKNTFTLAHERRAFVSQHIGDLDTLETLEHWQATFEAYQQLFRVTPELAVRDLHPDYLSTHIAEQLGLPRVLAVQHHHAHIAAVLGEHGRTGPVIGVAFDGTGYGEDGLTWGAEILIADLAGYRRAGHLQYAPMPGGDLAAWQPWRAARGYLSLEPGAAAAFARAFEGIGGDTLAVIDQQIHARVNAPLASSMGRLFDAAAAILGVRRVSAYEGQAAMELEALAGTRHALPLPFPIVRQDDGWVLDPIPLLAGLGKRARAGHYAAELAAAFHESIAAATAELVRRVAQAEGLRTAALGGGVFQNARLLRSLEARLRTMNIEVLVPRQLSPNDGAVSYGQAVVAAARLRQEQGG